MRELPEIDNVRNIGRGRDVGSVFWKTEAGKGQIMEIMEKNKREIVKNAHTVRWAFRNFLDVFLLWGAVLSLHYCTRAFLRCSEQGLLASLVVEYGR